MWYVFNEHGERYCEAVTETEAEEIAREIGGYVRYIDERR